MSPESAPNSPAVVSGSLLRFSRDPMGFLEEVAAKHGDFVSVRMIGYPFYLINDRPRVEELLRNKDGHFIKDKWSRMLSRVIGNGLVISDGEFWKTQRKAAQPAFHPNLLAGWANLFVEYSRDARKGWEDGRVIAIEDEMMKLTLRIMGRVLFNVDVARESASVGEAMMQASTYFADVLNVLLPLWLPTPANFRLKRAVRELDRLTHALAASAPGDDGVPTIQGILRSAGMSGTVLRDELVTFLLAGHETTSLGLTFAMDLVLKHPPVLERLMAEIRTVAGDRPIAAEDYRKLVYARHVMQEALRLYPPAWSLGREAVRDCELGGSPIPKGTQLLIGTWLLHRDARYFKDPLEFRPERWGTMTEHDLAFVYIPFGAGPRACIGREFATMEAVLILATLLQTCRIELLSDAPLEFLASVTLRPRKPVLARVRGM